MNAEFSRRLAVPLSVASFLLIAAAGCKHDPQISRTPPSQTQAPILRTAPRLTVTPRERELQVQIDAMQEQLKLFAARTEALWGFYGIRMSPKWAEKVQAARAEASKSSDRVRYLEATKALLSQTLEALRSELKVYEEFQKSDPAIPRP